MNSAGQSNNTMGGNNSAWNNQTNQQNTNNNLFRSNTMPSSLFPGPGIAPNNNAGTGTPNMFQTTNNAGNNTNNLFRSNTMNTNTSQPNFLNPNSSNTGNNSFNNNLFNVNNDQSSRSHGYNTRNSVLPPFGDKGTINIKYMPRRNMENLLICSITSAKECKDKVSIFLLYLLLNLRISFS